jgi:hypothetical protein
MSHTTITLHLPRSCPLEAVRALADGIGCRLRQRPDGSYIAVPAARPGNVVTLPTPRPARPLGGPDAA